MKLRTELWTMIVLCTLSVSQAFAKTAPVITADEQAQITERGRAIYSYDQAAWHATDAVKAANPAKEEVGRYIARKTDKGWVVAFGHLNEARDAFLVSYLATQGQTLQEFSVEHLVTPQSDTGFYLFAANAIDLALRDFQGEKRPYNIAILPATDGKLYVYVYPAQVENGVYPHGGDERYLITADGSSIIEKRRLHNDILVFDIRATNGSSPQSGWHTHVLSEVPEDTDVYYVLARRPSIPEYIGTPGKRFYVVTEDGTVLFAK